MAEQKEDAIKSIKKDKEPDKTPELIAKENETVKTIMPTMIDDSQDDAVVKRRDLSSIIPEFNPALKQAPTDVELFSKDNVLKTDGSVSIATLDRNGEANVVQNFAYPLPIDIDARKEEQQRAKRTTVKKVKKKMSKSAKQFQNQMSIMSLVIIAGLAVAIYWIMNAPKETDFTPQNITIELGETLPLHTSAYVKPARGEINEMLYTIDKTQINIDKVGDYPFSVHYRRVDGKGEVIESTKEGRVIIEDTTAPVLIVRNVTIIEGGTFDAESFVGSCIDHTGCKYTFQDVDIPKKYTTAGVYDVYITAFDAYQNSTTKKASLIIEAEGSVKNYQRTGNFDFNTGYQIIEHYELHFDEYETHSTLINGIYTRTFKYQDSEKYQEARQTYNGEPNYKCNDNDMTIVFNQTVHTIGSNYSDFSNIHTYLLREGFKAE